MSLVLPGRVCRAAQELRVRIEIRLDQREDVGVPHVVVSARSGKHFAAGRRRDEAPAVRVRVWVGGGEAISVVVSLKATEMGFPEKWKYERDSREKKTTTQSLTLGGRNVGTIGQRGTGCTVPEVNVPYREHAHVVNVGGVRTGRVARHFTRVVELGRTHNKTLSVTRKDHAASKTSPDAQRSRNVDGERQDPVPWIDSFVLLSVHQDAGHSIALVDERRPNCKRCVLGSKGKGGSQLLTLQGADEW